VGDLVAVLLERRAPDLRSGTRAEPLRQLLTDLDLVRDGRALQRLVIRVHGHEFDAPQILLHHPLDRVAAPATYADDLDAGGSEFGISPVDVRRNRIHAEKTSDAGPVGSGRVKVEYLIPPRR
jgi:hypothetical protein